jgi:hypothetical protein
MLLLLVSGSTINASLHDPVFIQGPSALRPTGSLTNRLAPRPLWEGNGAQSSAPGDGPVAREGHVWIMLLRLYHGGVSLSIG